MMICDWTGGLEGPQERDTVPPSSTEYMVGRNRQSVYFFIFWIPRMTSDVASDMNMIQVRMNDSLHR